MLQRSLLPWLPTLAHIPETLQYCDPETTRMPTKAGGGVGGVGPADGEAEIKGKKGIRNYRKRKSDKRVTDRRKGKGLSSSSNCALSECRGPRVPVLGLPTRMPPCK